MSESANHPELSVVIIAYNERHAIERCLTSLERQKTVRAFEVILIDSSNDGTDTIARRFPFVRVQHFAERKYPGDGRNAGIALARGNIIAFLDADCMVENDWIDEVAKAHQSPHLAVGSAIINGSPGSLVGWAYYFCEFNLWVPRREPCEIGEMAACGLSIKRRAFEQYGPFITDTYCSDTAFHWRLARDGHKVLFVPSIRVAHTARYQLGEFLRHIAAHRRSFARVVVQEKKFSMPKRFAAALATVFLPPLLVPVIAWRVTRSEHLLRPFLLALPVVFLGVLARAWGEFLGFATTQGCAVRPPPDSRRTT
jgi:glycosyltransferase involved in cell wall biosynthesis